MAPTRSNDSRCRACGLRLPTDEADGEVWAACCPECGFPSFQLPDQWTVQTTDLRLLSFRSEDQVRRAFHARLLGPTDLVFPPDGDEFVIVDRWGEEEDVVSDPSTDSGSSELENRTQQPDEHFSSTETPRRQPSRRTRSAPPSRPPLSSEATAQMDQMLASLPKEESDITKRLSDVAGPFFDEEVRELEPPRVEPVEDFSFESEEENRALSPARSSRPAPLPDSLSPVRVALRNRSTSAHSAPLTSRRFTVLISLLTLSLGAASGIGFLLYSQRTALEERAPQIGESSAPGNGTHPASGSEDKTATIHSALADELAQAEVTFDLNSQQRLLERKFKLGRFTRGDFERLSKVTWQIADQKWLKVRAMTLGVSSPPSEETDARAALRKAVDAASWAAHLLQEKYPDSPVGRLAQMNTHRIRGELKKARELADQMKDASDLVSYSLGALELADPKTSHLGAIPYLQAETREGPPGAVQAALTYAYLGLGREEEAAKEFLALQLVVPAHPATESLRRLLPRRAENTQRVDSPQSRLPTAADYLVAARRVRARGARSKARTLYHYALAQEPDSCVALSGLGTLASEEKDYGLAGHYLRAALASDRKCLDAHLGLADLAWNEGHHDLAKRRYESLRSSYPSSQIPDYVETRLLK